MCVACFCVRVRAGLCVCVSRCVGIERLLRLVNFYSARGNTISKPEEANSEKIKTKQIVRKKRR